MYFEDVLIYGKNESEKISAVIEEILSKKFPFNQDLGIISNSFPNSVKASNGIENSGFHVSSQTHEKAPTLRGFHLVKEDS